MSATLTTPLPDALPAPRHDLAPMAGLLAGAGIASVLWAIPIATWLWLK